MSRLTRDGTAEPVSRDQILRRELEQGNIHFPCLADHEQDWQPYPVDLYSCYRLRVTIHADRHVYIILLIAHNEVAFMCPRTPPYSRLEKTQQRQPGKNHVLKIRTCKMGDRGIVV